MKLELYFRGGILVFQKTVIHRTFYSSLINYEKALFDAYQNYFKLKFSLFFKYLRHKTNNNSTGTGNIVIGIKKKFCSVLPKEFGVRPSYGTPYYGGSITPSIGNRGEPIHHNMTGQKEHIPLTTQIQDPNN